MTRRVAAEAIADAGIEGAELDGIGITNQRETVVAWDPASGEPLHRALVWQDRRTAERCEELRAGRARASWSASAPGSSSTPTSPATKIEWLIAQRRGARARRSSGRSTPGCVFKLTGRHATDHTNASRTMLFDIHRLALGRGALRRCSASIRGACREALPSASVFGTTTEFGGEVPVAGIAGDQQAALFGQACHRAGHAPRTPTGPAASSCSTPAPTAPPPADGLLTTVACSSGGGPAYALEASIFVTGAAVQWLRDGLGVIDEAAETEALAASLEGNDGVYFVPGPDRPRLAPLGPLRARHDRRADPRQRPRPPGAGRARGDRLPDGRRGRAPRRRPAASAWRELKADGGAVANAG